MRIQEDMRGTSWQPIHLRDDKTHGGCLRGREHTQTPSEPLLTDGSDLLHADIRSLARTHDLNPAALTWTHGAAQSTNHHRGQRGIVALITDDNARSRLADLAAEHRVQPRPVDFIALHLRVRRGLAAKGGGR